MVSFESTIILNDCMQNADFEKEKQAKESIDNYGRQLLVQTFLPRYYLRGLQIYNPYASP